MPRAVTGVWQSFDASLGVDISLACAQASPREEGLLWGIPRQGQGIPWLIQMLH